MPKLHQDEIVVLYLTCAEIESITGSLRESIKRAQKHADEKPVLKEIANNYIKRINHLERKLHQMILVKE